jgi:hypothetical protein
LIKSLMMLGWLSFRGGRVEEARARLEEAVQEAIGAGNPVAVAEAMNSLGAFYYLRGNYGLAIRGYEDLLTHLKRSVLPKRRAH